MDRSFENHQPPQRDVARETVADMHQSLAPFAILDHMPSNRRASCVPVPSPALQAPLPSASPDHCVIVSVSAATNHSLLVSTAHRDDAYSTPLSRFAFYSLST